LVLQGNKRTPLRAAKNPVYLVNAAATVGTDLATCTAAGGGTVVTGTTSCLKCIKNVDAVTNAGVLTSVWCSGAWNYSYETSILAASPLYPHVAAGGTYTFSATGGDATAAGAAVTGDLGSCCYNGAVGTTYYSIAAAATSTASDLLNKINCPAKFSNDWIAATGAAVLTTTDWWCSDGTYNHNILTNTEGLGNL
jgi:hypothetical protein